jgi:flagellar motor switch protein FliM
MEFQTDALTPIGPLPIRPAACRPELLPGGQLDFARRAFQTFLDRLSEALSSYLCAPVEIRFSGADQMPLSKALGEDENQACLVRMDLSPFRGVAHLALGREFAGAALETLLGAPSDAAAIPRDSLTEVDLHLLGDLIALLTAELQQAWRPVCGCSFEQLSVHTWQTRPASDSGGASALVLTAEIVLNGSASALRLMVPSLLVRLAFEPSPEAAPESAGPGALLQAVSAASLDVEAVLGGARIRMRDLLDLRPGHTLELPHKTSAPIACQVNGLVKFRGELVGGGQSVGFQIQSGPAPR